MCTLDTLTKDERLASLVPFFLISGAVIIFMFLVVMLFFVAGCVDPAFGL